MTAIALVLLIVVLASLAYLRARLVASLVAAIALTLLFIVLPVNWVLVFVSGAVAAAFAFLLSKPLRRTVISDPLFTWFRRALPALSQTEQEALDAGTVWWDAELFSGKPQWRDLLAVPKPELSAEEQAFLDGPTEQLMGMLNEWEIDRHKDLSPEIWDFLKQNRFFSMLIPPQYGGLGFSALGNSAIVMKIASRNLTAAVTVMVPNSLGPGELLMHFGTEKQKDHYLPRLARGDEIPCFALTSPSAGSDAGAIPDTGVVCRGHWEGEEVLGLRLNWSKRYITLAPVATLIGLAFRTVDPDGLLGGEVDRGITCALVPASTPGVEIGQRHLPTGASFMNGPTRGTDVFIPLDLIIGGRERIGQGWRMLVQSLAAGRAISLPALGTAGSKLCALLTGEYSRIRKQFKMPIAYFEGVQEPLARIAGNTYRMDAARTLTLVALGLGEQPSVLTAIVKCYITEGNRTTLNDAMDVHGGKGIMQGPNNYLALAYQSIPIGITVEGANILTRTMIIFGQGAIRAHPFLLKEMRSASDPDPENARATFDEAFFGHIGFTLSNGVRCLLLGLTGARFVRAPATGKTAHYYRQLTHMSTAFAFCADLVLLVLGGTFKFREKLSGRLADILAHLYMCSAVLKRFEDDGRPAEDLPLVNWAMRDSLFLIQNRLVNILRNFPVWWLRRAIALVIFPLGHPYREPSDTLSKHVSRILTVEGPARDRLTDGIYHSQADDATGRVNRAFAAVLAAAPVERTLKAHYKRVVTLDNYEELASLGVADGLLSAAEGELVREAQRLSKIVIDVDQFSREEVEIGYPATAQLNKAKAG